MHIPTHIMSGWCIGNFFQLTPRERWFCMLAASLPDLDGFGMLLRREDLYFDYHHKLGHALAPGLLLCVALAAFSTHRAKAFLVYLFLFHLHLILDYYGSGPGWPLYYFWPFSSYEFVNRRAWDFFSWQNITAGYAFLAWVLWIAARRGRTPLEVPMPSLDRQLVDLLRSRLPARRAAAGATEAAPEPAPADRGRAGDK